MNQQERMQLLLLSLPDEQLRGENGRIFPLDLLFYMYKYIFFSKEKKKRNMDLDIYDIVQLPAFF